MFFGGWAAGKDPPARLMDPSLAKPEFAPALPGVSCRPGLPYTAA